MLLLRIIKYKFILAIPLLLMSICLTADTGFSKEENSAKFYQSFLDLIESTPKENRHLLDGWNDYITKVMGYSNAEHLKVIEELTLDYAKAFNALDEKYAKDWEQDKKKYTSEWLDELVAQFGKNFVCNSKRVVMLNLMMAFNRNDAKKYDQDAKDVISKELVLYLAYEEYLGVFMDYYKQLSENDQKKMNSWKEASEKCLSVTNRSHFAQIYYGFHMINKIRDNSLKTENEELYIFFKNANFLYGSGVSKKVERDIDMLVEECRRQSSKQPDNN